MVGLVIVSHSRPLAVAVQNLVRAMTGDGLPLAIAAGAGDDRTDLGTDAVEIMQAIQSVMSEEGVLVLMDMGSAILSAETALDFLEEAQRAKVRICSAPLVEGAVSAGVTANLGQSLDDVAQEAMQALRLKSQHLHAGSPPAPAAAPAPKAGGDSITVSIRNPHGLHARPAARFMKECGHFQAEIAVENLTRHRGPVPAKSMVALASLEILHGHEVRISAKGPDAAAALKALQALADDQFGEASPVAPEPVLSVVNKDGKPAAIPVATGIAIGPVHVMTKAAFDVPQNKVENVEAETAHLKAALASARVTLLNEARRIKDRADVPTAEIFEAQALVLDDPDLLSRAFASIAQDKLNAALAWDLSLKKLEEQYRNFTDEYLRQRAADVVDAGGRVLSELGLQAKGEVIPKDCVLVAEDLLPAEVTQLSAGRVAGVMLLDGGRTSHSSILLRMLGIPAIAQGRAFFNAEQPPRVLAFNGGTGELWADPAPEKLTELRRIQKAQLEEHAREIKFASEPAVTLEGHRVEVFANVTTEEEARAALQAGAEGVGLLRTEFLFLERPSPPDEEEQYRAVRPVVEAMNGKTVVVRTLDAGGDKELGYLGLPREANPFLGVRGLRVCLRQPGLFHTQLRALLRAGSKRDLQLLFPMLAEPAEFRAAREAVQAAHDELRRQGIPHAWPVKLGAMIEIPSAALLAEPLAELADFFSIGTNDLTQYTLAADRGNPQLGNFQDALHPAVLLLIQRLVEAAHRKGKSVAVCGEAAADPHTALVLAGLGVDELSMSPGAIPKIKAALRRVNYADLQQLAHQVLKLQGAGDVRGVVAGYFDHYVAAQTSAA
ncbi:MAG: phosphoenolpyruvate--protein phosphotransferase [Chthoniobacteraceae bacterium]